MNGNPSGTLEPTPKLIGKAIGYINRHFENVYPLVQHLVFSNLVNPDQGYLLYLDAPSLAFDPSAYTSPGYNILKDPNVNITFEILDTYLTTVGNNSEFRVLVVRRVFGLILKVQLLSRNFMRWLYSLHCSVNIQKEIIGLNAT